MVFLCFTFFAFNENLIQIMILNARTLFSIHDDKYIHLRDYIVLFVKNQRH